MPKPDLDLHIQRVAKLGYSESSNVFTISGSLEQNRIRELMDVAAQSGHMVVVEGGVLKVKHKHAPAAEPWYSGATTQLAWFYQRPGLVPPLYTDYYVNAATIVARHKLIICSGSDTEVNVPSAWGYPAGTSWFEAFKLELAAAGRGSEKILQYIDAPMTRGPDTAPGTCPANYSSMTTMWASRVGDFCNRMNPNESWFVHNSTGARIYRNPGAPDRHFLLNPGSSGLRSYTVTKVAEIQADYGMDGLFLDDVWATATRPRNQESNSDGVVQEYATDAAWKADFATWLQELKTASGSRPVWINSDNSTDLVDPVDAFMIENLGASWGAGWMTQAETVQRLTDVANHTALGKQAVLVGQSNGGLDYQDPVNIARMRYSHALYLMVAHPKVYFRFDNASDYRRFNDYPEYLWNIGAPVGARFMATAQTMRRNFSGGIALVNMSESVTDSGIPLGGTYTFPDNTTASTATLPPRTGLMLRAV